MSKKHNVNVYNINKRFLWITCMIIVIMSIILTFVIVNMRIYFDRDVPIFYIDDLPISWNWNEFSSIWTGILLGIFVSAPVLLIFYNLMIQKKKRK